MQWWSKLGTHLIVKNSLPITLPTMFTGLITITITITTVSQLFMISFELNIFKYFSAFVIVNYFVRGIVKYC